MLKFILKKNGIFKVKKEKEVEGAKWADKTMLDNACEWLDYTSFNGRRQ